MPVLDNARAAIREEGLSGWLLHNVFHRDEIADLLLEVPRDRSNTRPWTCVLLPEGDPVKIVHRIEASVLAHVPGRTILYHTREEYLRALSSALPRGGPVAADFSPDFPVVSFLDHGMARLAEGLGARLVPSAALVARTLGTIDREGIRSHEAAAKVLYAEVGKAWSRIGEELRRGSRLSEADVQGWLSRGLAAAKLVSDGPALVASGPHTADPHYAVSGRGALLEPGDVVLFDVWAREDSPSSVFADISWVGVLAKEPSERHRESFAAIVAAREAAVRCLEQGLGSGGKVRGAEVDAAARETLARLGFSAAIRHRTGHSIGNRVHGFGVNLDSVEFPDTRVIPEGACVSIEPGVYFEDFGMRTEIDVYIQDGRLVVSGGERQRALLCLG